MRILFLAHFFDPEPGAIRGLPLARWLVSRGHQVEVITGFPNYPGGKIYPGYRVRAWQKETVDGVQILRVPIYPSHDRNAPRRVLNYLSFALAASTIGLALSHRPDVLYVYHPPATVGLSGLLFQALRNVPVVYHIADMWPESVIESGMIREGSPKKIVKWTLEKMCSAIYSRANKITVLSPGFRRLLIERGVPESKIHIIYNWVAEEVFKPVKFDASLAEQLGMKDRFNVLYAGNFGAFQGLKTVVRAAARLRDFPKIQIVLAGTGQQEAALRTLSAELRTGNVLFLGPRPYREMSEINALADVFLVHLKDLPFFASTIPSKTQVALACERPVLMAVRGDAAELIRRSGGGLVCEPENEEALAESILRLYRMSPHERQEMGRRGRGFYLQEMSMEVGGELMEKLLLSLVSNSPQLVRSREAQRITE